MAESKIEMEFKYLEDEQKLKRRLKNREAVKRHRKNEAIKEKIRLEKEQNLRLENAKLKGEIDQMKNSRNILLSIVIDRLRRNGQQLSQQQLDFFKDDDDDDDDSEDENKNNKKK